MGFDNVFVRIGEVDVDAKSGSQSSARDMAGEIFLKSPLFLRGH